MDRAAEATASLKLIEEKRSEFSYHASVSRWIAKADRCNKDFFSAFRMRPAGSTLRALCDSHGILQSHPDTVLSLASEYYASLFSADIASDDIRLARDEVLSHVRHVVTPAMCQELLSPFSLTELQDAIAALDVASCPGDDGLTRDFFQTFWDDIQLPLLYGLQHIFDTRYMP